MKKLIVLFALSLNISFAATYELKPTSEAVSFHAKGRPSFIAINGAGSGLMGVIHHQGEEIKGELELDLSTLTTGIELRDDHLKNKYLNVAEFPKAKLVLSEGTKTDGDKFQFKGVLSLRGEKRTIEGTGSLLKDRLTAEFALNLSDFKIEIPSFQGITVAEKVIIKVNAPIVEGQIKN